MEVFVPFLFRLFYPLKEQIPYQITRSTILSTNKIVFKGIYIGSYSYPKKVLATPQENKSKLFLTESWVFSHKHLLTFFSNLNT